MIEATAVAQPLEVCEAPIGWRAGRSVSGFGAGDRACQYVLGMVEKPPTVEVVEQGWLRRERVELLSLLGAPELNVLNAKDAPEAL